MRLIPPHDHGGRSSQDLATALEARGYRVTLRTVERDLGTLQHCMSLESNAKTRPQRWRWQKTRGIDIPGMEAAEAMALFMMQDAMRDHLPSCFVDALHNRFAQANKTLAALARGGANVRWADRVRVVPAHVVLRPPPIAPRLIQSLQNAVLNDIAVDADYHGLQDLETRRRLLYPRALILRGSSLYLIAHERGGGAAPHHFAVQRFKAVKLRELEPWTDLPFSLAAFLADGTGQFGDGRRIVLEASITAALGKILRDCPLSDDMRIDDDDGHLTLRATVRDTWSLHTWILGHAESLCIQSPPALRQLIVGRLRAASAPYG